jgi:CheY-like chemotaxis protein
MSLLLSRTRVEREVTTLETRAITGDVFAVDDNPVNVRRLVEVLRTAGISVRAATSGVRALEAMREKRPDLVLLDVEMPGLDGWAVHEALRASEELSGVPVVFVSAHDSVLERARAFRSGAADWLTKPFDEAEILARVTTQLQLVRLSNENAALRAELAKR